MTHRFPIWKYGLLIVILVISCIYSLPNMYGEDPAVQITGINGVAISAEQLQDLTVYLDQQKIPVKLTSLANNTALLRFFSTEQQLQANDLIKHKLGNNYSVALNLAQVTPGWLSCLGAKPMKLGLDLRGGVRFVMDVDVSTNVRRRLEAEFSEIRAALRKENIRYLSFSLREDNTIYASFASIDARAKAYNYLFKNYPQYEYIQLEQEPQFALELTLAANQLQEVKKYTIEQTMATLRNRINELGVAEALVQQQGLNRVVIELPGIQDTARAKDILGKTATLDFVLVDHDNDLQKALRGHMPPGSRVVFERLGRPVLVKKRVILTGDSITGASSGLDSEEHRPAVNVRLGGGGIGLFKKTTSENIGRAMAVIYRETKIEERNINGKIIKDKITSEHVISVATIQAALGSSFRITGLKLEEARDLALLLRAGALPASISIVEEQIIGPSMGRDNIEKGVISGIIGLVLVFLFMGSYYSVFGWFANIALVFNLILLVAVMSLIGATLTLPGIAGIVLTLGMAVDANVLIFERIREELRLGISKQASIQLGFEHAFATIVDANLTTLIVGVILFSLGSGPVKGFAVTLSIGILTSMFTAITGTRALVNAFYSSKTLKHVPVGM